MTQGTFINLKIDKSLSYTIDKQLDDEFGQDVKFNKTQWESVFDIIKEDNATTQKQYRGGDSNINSGKNFVVDQGQNYKITQDAWNKIKAIAANVIIQFNPDNITPETPEVPVFAPQQKNVAQEEIYNAQVEEILKNNNIDTSDIDIKDVVNKYKAIVDYNQKNGITTNQTTLENRIINYTKGLKYHNFEEKAQTDVNAEFQSDCSNAKTYEDLAKAYKEFGKGYVEFMDYDGDGEINVHEMFYQELQDYYTMYGDNKLVAKRKAIETLEKFKNFNKDNLPTEDSELYDTNEMELFTTVLKKIGLLDADKNGQISSDEAGAYLMTTAQSLDQKNNIKAAEATQMERGIAAEGYDENDLKELGYNETEAKNILSFTDYFKKNFSIYLEFIKTGRIPSKK